MAGHDLADLLILSEYHVVQGDYRGLRGPIGLLDNLHHALEAVLHSVEVVHSRCKRVIAIHLLLILLIELEGLSVLLELHQVQDQALEVHARVLGEVHLVDHEIRVEVAEEEVLLQLRMQGLQDLGGDPKELPA